MTDVEAYYDQNADAEWERLERHRTEFAVVRRALKEFLPPPPALVLDAGSGPGRYAIALARQGYTVTVCDISQASLDLAQKRAQAAGVKLRGAIHASAVDLSMLDATAYDAVLLMGPLYHLLAKEERLRAIRSALRLLKPQGVVFASFITRFAPFRDAAIKDPALVLNTLAYTERLLATGIHDQAEAFADAYFAHPDEVIPLMEEGGYQTTALVGCEGVVAGHEDKINALGGRLWEQWVDLNYRMGKDPSLRGAADHLLYVGRKPA